MKLFYAPASPFARKARISARLLGLMDRVEEVLVNPFQDDARLHAVNPAGLVPALALDDGSALIDSPVICGYLNDVSPSGRLLPPGGEARWRVLHHQALADAIMDFAVAAMYDKRRTDVPPNTLFVERRMQQVMRTITSLPNQSEALDLGTVATACALSYLDFRFPEIDWRARRPDLAQWHARVDATDAFAETRPADHAL